MEQQQQVNESSNMDHFEPDPLLQPGAFIDPNPPTNPPNGVAEKKSKGKSSSSSSPSTVDPTPDSSKPSDETPVSERPAWLPSAWGFTERVRISGASAGSRDKYYMCPVTGRKFRSKQEVFYYIETGSTKKRKIADSDAGSTPATDSPAKGKKKSEGKKSEAKAKKNSLENFNFDDVPGKVKWMLTDIYELTWRPLVNGVDRVPESAKQEWSAAFTYLTLQNGGGNAFL